MTSTSTSWRCAVHPEALNLTLAVTLTLIPGLHPTVNPKPDTYPTPTSAHSCADPTSTSTLSLILASAPA